VLELVWIGGPLLLATSRRIPLLNLAFLAFAGTHGGVAWAGVLVAI
jgi:hypothetical protein